MDLFSKINANMEALTATFSSRMLQYEDSLQKVSSEASEHKDLSSLSRDFSDFKALIWRTVALFKSQIELLVQGFDKHEMASRRKVLLLHGIPDDPNITSTQIALDVFSRHLKLDNIHEDDFVGCHRLGSSGSKPRPVLVRFSSFKHRSAVWNAKTSLRGTGITISEFLTKTRHDVFMAARKHFGLQQCWTVEGKINVQLPDKSRKKVETMPELFRLIEQFPTVVKAPQSSSTAIGSIKSPAVTGVSAARSKPAGKPSSTKPPTTRSQNKT